MPDYWNVFLARYSLGVADPDMPGTRYHTVLFVETGVDRSGLLHQVTGDITSDSGMCYTPQPSEFPEHSESNISCERLGFTPVSKHPGHWERVLGAVPPPPKQKHFNPETKTTEPFKTRLPMTFYAPGEPRRPLIKCTEWTLERAIPALKQYGLIIQL